MNWPLINRPGQTDLFGRFDGVFSYTAAGWSLWRLPLLATARMFISLVVLTYAVLAGNGQSSRVSAYDTIIDGSGFMFRNDCRCT